MLVSSPRFSMNCCAALRRQLPKLLRGIFDATVLVNFALNPAGVLHFVEAEKTITSPLCGCHLKEARHKQVFRIIITPFLLLSILHTLVPVRHRDKLSLCLKAAYGAMGNPSYILILIPFATGSTLRICPHIGMSQLMHAPESQERPAAEASQVHRLSRIVNLIINCSS